MLAILFSTNESLSVQDIISSLYIKHRTFMFHIANKTLHDPQASEDVVHDAFVRILSKFQKLDINDDKKVKSLFGIIVEGLAKDEYRRRKHIDLFDEEPEISEPETVCIDEQIIKQESYEELRAVISSLNTKCIGAFLMRYEHDFSSA